MDPNVWKVDTVTRKDYIFAAMSSGSLNGTKINYNSDVWQLMGRQRTALGPQECVPPPIPSTTGVPTIGGSTTGSTPGSTTAGSQTTSQGSTTGTSAGTTGSSQTTSGSTTGSSQTSTSGNQGSTTGSSQTGSTTPNEGGSTTSQSENLEDMNSGIVNGPIMVLLIACFAALL